MLVSPQQQLITDNPDAAIASTHHIMHRLLLVRRELHLNPTEKHCLLVTDNQNICSRFSATERTGIKSTGRGAGQIQTHTKKSRKIPFLRQAEKSFNPFNVNFHAPSSLSMSLLQTCTHQEARGIIQEAAKPAHKAPFQKGRVFQRQLIRLVGNSRKAETLLPCRREGLKKQ